MASKTLAQLHLWALAKKSRYHFCPHSPTSVSVKTPCSPQDLYPQASNFLSYTAMQLRQLTQTTESIPRIRSHQSTLVTVETCTGNLLGPFIPPRRRAASESLGCPTSGYLIYLPEYTTCARLPSLRDQAARALNSDESKKSRQDLHEEFC